MDGAELYERVVSTVQETILKIGDVVGSMSLYYPCTDDAERLAREFREAAPEELKGIIVERLPDRIRVIVPEDESRIIARMPVRKTMGYAISIAKERVPMDEFVARVGEMYPSARFMEMDHLEFDMLLTFPRELDPYFYCLAEEMGIVTFHRFSMDDYEAFGFPMPAINGSVS